MTDTTDTQGRADSPLTFADFLPDDRSPERIRVDGIREEIAAFMRGKPDHWAHWRSFIAEARGDTPMDRALFDIALRRELVASRRFAPPKAVLGLVFTEMDWWEPKGGLPSRDRELAQLAEAYGIEHLRPESEAEEPDEDNKPYPGVTIFWVFIAILTIAIFLS